MDIHILTVDKGQKSASVVFHIPVPTTGANGAGLSWPDAVVREQGGSGSIASVLPGISAGEDTALKAGELIEYITSVRFSSRHLTNAERLAEIKNAFAEIKTDLIAEKQITLAFIGYETAAAA